MKTLTSKYYYHLSSLLIVIVVILSLFNPNVLAAAANDPVCISDELITGQAVQVDWWFIIKIRGFSDVYYYYDSTMTAAEFKIGHFLRSRYSAFGATLLPYANAVLDTLAYKNYKVAKDTGFLAYGDSLKHGEIDVKDFYTYGAHEKGLIGWSTKNPGVGLIIQHSLPNFPYGVGTTMNPPIINQYVLAVKDIPFVQMYFTQYGWKNNFFGKNLMPYYIPGRKHFAESKEPFMKYAVQTRSGGTKYGSIKYINHSDFELFSLLYTTLVKPSQQIFCSSLLDASTDPPSTPGKKVKDMVQYLSNLSDRGLFAAKHSDNAGKYFPSSGGLVSYPGDLAPEITREIDDEATNKHIYKEKTIKVGTFDYYMRITAGSDKSNGGKGKRVDVWRSLLLSPSNQPKLATTEEFYISTWANKAPDSWWKSNNKIISPTFKIKVYDNIFKWDGNTHQEHSKIGFRKSGGTDWNVCSSGGNLYFNDKKGIKSSLLICFKSDGLRGALLSILDSAADAAADVDADASEEDEDMVSAKKPGMLKNVQTFIKSLKKSAFKTNINSNYQLAESIAQFMDLAESKLSNKRKYVDHGVPPRTSPRLTMKDDSDSEDEQMIPSGKIIRQKGKDNSNSSNGNKQDDNDLVNLAEIVKKAIPQKLKEALHQKE